MRHLIFSTLIILLVSCSVKLPETSVMADKNVNIYPDYNEITLPCNIAPLNFKIDEKGDEFITRIYTSGNKVKPILVSGKKVIINPKRWKTFLSENKGDTLLIEIYEKNRDRWIKYPVLKNWIAPQTIDPYLSYRLIEPSYVTYEEMTINQRNITNFEESVIYENSMVSNRNDGQCINCHSFRNYNREGEMQMHVRQYYGGTVIVRNGEAEKIDLKTDYTISAGVYPSWHPEKLLIAYSVNNTGQNFHTRDHQKVEVLDTESDLILYDVEKNEVKIIANEKNEFETFPYWSADGKRLYYASAHFEYENPADKTARQIEVADKHKEIWYNIYKKSFNPETLEFGETDTVFMASDYGRSATFPRESPDGKYLLFTLGNYGNFHIWHKSSDLYLKDLTTGEVRPLKEINSDDVDSYHSWSSNGRWIVFSTRRDDGSYTRPYIAYFDESGRAHKPFILPQKDPDFYMNLFKSFNIPEFMIEPVTVPRYKFMTAIKKEAKKVTYRADTEDQKRKKKENDEHTNFYE